MTLKNIYEENKEPVTVILSVLSGTILVLINVLFIGKKSDLPVDNDFLFTTINIIAVGVICLPIAIVYYKRYKQVQAFEEAYPDFLRTIVEGLNGGMSLPLAISYASQSNYGILTPHVRKLVAQMSWGINFENALENFASSLNSPVITRSVSTIIECHRSGGNIADVLSAVSGSLIEIEKIRRERSMMISGQMMTGYIIFFVFIVVMIGIREFLLRGFDMGTDSDSEMFLRGPTVTEDMLDNYGKMFTHLAIIQGFFAGLVIGKLSEGRLSAGAKHAIILALVGYMALTLAHGIVETLGI